MPAKILEVRQYHISQVPKFMIRDWAFMEVNDEKRYPLGMGIEVGPFLFVRKDRHQRVSVWRSDGKPVIYPK
jgi:hypothetical protein